VRRFTLIAGLAAALLAASPAQAAPCANADTVPGLANAKQVRQATLCLLNVKRRSHGRPSLRPNAGLALAGRRHARDMVRRRYFAHDSKAGRSFDVRIRNTGYLRGARSGAVMGENLGWASGPLATPRAMVRAWMRSPGHRANILRPAFREVGIAVVTRTPGGSGGATYATEFGRRF
jgi:uncharacterized protein YkwD